MINEDIEKQLKNIKQEVLACQKCSLYKNRIYPVIGQGNHQAKIVFVGEAPGFSESKTGYPFCGSSGKILDELLESIDIKREDVYITNLLKDRPPNNRDPEIEEIKACYPYLEKQLELIKPKVICLLGRHAMQFLMKEFGLEKEIQPISKIHGQVFQSDKLSGGVKIIPLYHPAVAAYNINMKSVLIEDFQALKKIE
jgi:DNA polymerase